MTSISPQPPLQSWSRQTWELDNMVDPQPDAEHNATPESTELETEALPPTDHGRQAYLVLAGCSLIQAPVWGYPLAYGVFLEYYTSSDASGVSGSAGTFATVGTTLAGIMYLMMPGTFALLTRYPGLRRHCEVVGLLLTVGSLIASSFATEAWQLVLTQGVLCAVGSGLLFAPTTRYLDEWFVKRKGWAYAVMWSGKSAAGGAMPFLMDALLSKYGSRTTLQIWAATLFVLTCPLFYVLKPRVPISSRRATAPGPRLSWAFLSVPLFWMLQAGNIMQGMGYFLPSTYMSAYAHLLSAPGWVGTLVVALNSVASIPGSLVLGAMCDRRPAAFMSFLVSIASALSVFLLWGLSENVALLVVFVVVYGFFAGSFSTTWAAILRDVQRSERGTDSGLVLGLLLGGRGIGNVLSGPLSAALLSSPWATAAKGSGWGYTSEYGPLIIFTGATALFGGWAWMWQNVRRAM